MQGISAACTVGGLCVKDRMCDACMFDKGSAQVCMYVEISAVKVLLWYPTNI